MSGGLGWGPQFTSGHLLAARGCSRMELHLSKYPLSSSEKQGVSLMGMDVVMMWDINMR